MDFGKSILNDIRSVWYCDEYIVFIMYVHIYPDIYVIHRYISLPEVS